MPAGSQPYAPSLTAGATSPDSSVEPYDYSAAIDPALEGTGASQMQVHSSLYDGTHEAKLGGMYYTSSNPRRYSVFSAWSSQIISVFSMLIAVHL